MLRRQPHIANPGPALWLISDARNDALLEAALCALPRGSGFIFRHYHLGREERAARFSELARLARARGHIVLLAGSERWRADGSYAGGRPRHAGIRALTAHSLREIGAVNRAGADMVLLSPVFPTRSHPSAKALGPLRFRLLAGRAKAPVIALGGMNPRRARRLRWRRWAAIDGLCALT